MYNNRLFITLKVKNTLQLIMNDYTYILVYMKYKNMEYCMNKFVLEPNKFLEKKCEGFSNQFYTGYGNDGNPDFLNKLKNNFHDVPKKNLKEAQGEVKEILKQDIPAVQEIIKNEMQCDDCMVVCVPRSRAEDKLYPNQKLFRETVSEVAQELPHIKDGTQAIHRHGTVKTTHIKKENITFPCNDGTVIKNDEYPKPYPGITEDTCTIDENMIKDQHVILVDDVYTKSSNVDEDCIQVLRKKGAKSVHLYTIGYTQRG